MLMRDHYGFTLVELIFALAIVALLMLLGLPSYQAWIQNVKIRNTAESILNGMQLSKAEAVRRNMNVGFYLVSSMDASCALDDTHSNWIVGLQEPNANCNEAPSETVAPQIIQKRSEQEGATEGLTISTLPSGASSFVFTPLGRGNAVGSEITQVDVGISSSISGVRNLRILVGAGGSLKMCDPNLTNDDPRKC